MSDARAVILRAVLREGLLEARARREAIEQLYHVERLRDGMADGPEFWYEIEFDADSVIRQAM